MKAVHLRVVIASARGVVMTACVCAVFAAAVAAGCATLAASAPKKETLPDGSFRLKCSTPLPRCLDAAEEICHGTRYRVVSAEDNHIYTGPHGWEGEARTSEAVFRCGTRGVRLWGEDETAAPGGPAAEASPEAPRPLDAARATTTAPAPNGVCVPGSTQGCVGAAACQGGQFCLTDGAGFSPCDCGRGEDKDKDKDKEKEKEKDAGATGRGAQ